MASLGAGAGAHKGDMDRAELAEKRRQANMQYSINKQRLKQESELSDKRMSAEEKRLGAEQERWEQTYQAQQRQYYRQEKQWDEQNRQWEISRQEKRRREIEEDDFKRSQQEDKNKWAAVLDAQKEREAEENAARVKAITEKYEQENAAFEEQRTRQREFMKGETAGFLMAAFNNQGIASIPSIEMYNKATGNNVVAGYFVDDMFMVEQKVIGQDGKPVLDESGNPMIEAIVWDKDLVNNIKAYTMGVDIKNVGASNRPKGSPVPGIPSEEDDIKTDAEERIKQLNIEIRDARAAIMGSDLDSNNESSKRLNRLIEERERLHKVAYGSAGSFGDGDGSRASRIWEQ